jgi:ISHne3, transposase
MESTGGLEIPLAKTLHRAGFRVVIANPSRTKSYANGFSPAKTDHLDAKMLADYAQALEIKGLVANMLYTPPNEAEEKLEALVKRRSQPVDIRAAEKNRLD